MNQREENELVAVHLARVPWWRAALARFGAKQKLSRHQQTLERLAQADVTDTIGEADVKSWLKFLAAGSASASDTESSSAQEASQEPRAPLR